MAPPAIDPTKKLAPPADAVPPPEETTGTAPTEEAPQEEAPADTSTQTPNGRVRTHTELGKVKTSVTPPNDAFVLRPGIGLGGFGGALGSVGGPNGNVFQLDSSPANANGKWTFVDLSLDFDIRLARLFGDKASLFVQLSPGYENHGSQLSTGGSYMNVGKLGVGLALDWKNSMASWSVSAPSRLGIGACGLYGSGKTTAGNHFSIDDTSGFGYCLYTDVDLFGFKINQAGDSVQLTWRAATGVIPNARGDADYPYWFTGPRITVPLEWPGSIRVERREDQVISETTCLADQNSLDAQAEKIADLREEVSTALAGYKLLTEYLQSKGHTPEKIRDAIRRGIVDRLRSEEAAKPEYASKKQEAIAAAVAAKQAAFEKEAKAKYPKDEAAQKKYIEDAKIAEAANPEVIQKGEEVVMGLLDAKKAEFEAQAAKKIPDDYNHYNIDTPQGIDIAGTEIPTDCEEREDLAKRLNDELITLNITKTRIEERTKWMFFALGNKAVRHIMNNLGGMALTQFPPVNFVSGQPDYGIKNEGPGKRGAKMDALEKFYEANKGKVFTPKDPSLNKAFKGIFAGNELLAFQDVVLQLNGEKPLRGVKTSKVPAAEITAMAKKIPLLIQAHVSITDGTTEKNQVLSDNRARAVEIALILLGMDPARLRIEGKGEAEPIVPETEDWSKGGKKVKNLSWAREKNRRVMFLVDLDKMEAAEGITPAAAEPAPVKVAPPAPVLAPATEDATKPLPLVPLGGSPPPPPTEPLPPTEPPPLVAPPPPAGNDFVPVPLPTPATGSGDKK